METNQIDAVELFTPEEIARNKAGVAISAARYTVKAAIKDIEQGGTGIPGTIAMKALEALGALDGAAVDLWADERNSRNRSAAARCTEEGKMKSVENLGHQSVAGTRIRESGEWDR